MNTFQRAFYYVLRKKEKSIVLLLILIVLLMLILMGNVIEHSAADTKAELYEKLGGYFKISVDYNKIENTEMVDAELVDHILNIDGVDSVNPLQITYLTLPEISLVPSKWALEGDSKANLTSFIGCKDSSMHEYFRLNFFVMEEGRYIRDNDLGTVMISTDIAKQNHLQIGDKIKAVISEDGYWENDAVGESVELEIVGIFSDEYGQEGDAWTEERSIPSNFMFIDYETSRELTAIIGDSADVYNAGAMFYVSKPEQLDEIVNEVQKIESIDWSGLKITKNNYAYEKNAAPLEILHNSTSILAFLITIIGLCLVALLLILWQRDRVHEVGILMSLGIPKRSIFIQHLLESVVIFVIAFGIMLAISKPVSNQIGMMIYGEVIAKAEEIEEDDSLLMYEPVDLRAAEVDVEFEIEITSGIYIFTGLAGLFIILISVGSSFISVVRRDPGEIMVTME